ncbi:MAG: LPXTG cell wall anchor domain-containing protein [Acidimicrobiales bacterium]
MSEFQIVSRTWHIALLLVGVGVALALPVGALAQDSKPSIAVTKVDLASDMVEITNHGDVEVDVNGMFLCNFPSYSPIADAPVIGAGETITVDAGALGVNFDEAQGEVGLYLSSAYDASSEIVSYVEWGEAGHTRSSVGIAAGVWAEGFVAVGDGVLIANNTSPSLPSDWVIEAVAQPDDDSEDEAADELAQTGADTDGLLLVGFGAIVTGSAMLVLRRSRFATIR